MFKKKTDINLSTETGGVTSVEEGKTTETVEDEPVTMVYIPEWDATVPVYKGGK